MKHLFYTLIFGMSFFLMAAKSNAQGLSILIDSFEVQAGQEICIPVKCKGFVQVSSFQFSLTWNSAVLKFKKTQQYGLAGMNPGDFNGSFSPDRLLLGWADSLGGCRDKADEAVLFEACFTALGPVNSSTLIYAGGNGFPPGNGTAEAYNCSNQNIWTQAGTDTGFLKIVAFSEVSDPLQNAKPVLQLFPNPAHSEAQLVFHSEISGSAIIIMCDMLGRSALKQKIQVIPGENRFEIPASALNTKGLYQVSLQTEQGIGTKVLSVY